MTAARLAAAAAVAALAAAAWLWLRRAPSTLRRWAAEQLALKRKLKTADAAVIRAMAQSLASGDGRAWRVAGVDLSFVPGDATKAVACLVVVELPGLRRLAGLSELVSLEGPYVPGFLAFREAPHYVRLLDRLRRERPDAVPHALLVDGNGALHPRGFGLAAHVGVLAGVPTIGAAKTLQRVDGLDERAERARCRGLRRGEHLPLVGASGRTWGAALRSSAAGEGEPARPIYVSAGHGVSLASATLITRACCNTRVPEPVRLADLEGREIVRNLAPS